MKKRSFFSFFLFNFSLILLVYMVFDNRKHHLSLSLRRALQPDFHATKQTKADEILKAKMSDVRFEKAYGEVARQEVQRKVIEKYGGKIVTLRNEKEMKIACLCFQRENAPINIIYVTGYFHNFTPTKEWVAPFAIMFPHYNIFSFDWRGFGDSQGWNPFLLPNDFGAHAYHDLQAVIEYVRKQNDKPIVLHGFCFGGAMALHTTVQAQKAGKPVADALGLSSMFTTFRNVLNRSSAFTPSWFYWSLIRIGLAPLILNMMANGSPFTLLPIELIKKINMPCWFDHITHDRLAVLSEAAAVYHAAQSNKKMFFQSDFGYHARAHLDVCDQYRVAYKTFLKKAGLLT